VLCCGSTMQCRRLWRSTRASSCGASPHRGQGMSPASVILRHW
jgi:hypothetical protein